MAAYKLTCLRCKEDVEEWTDSQEPAVMIFDCLKCGSHWVVGSTTIHAGSTTKPRPLDEEPTSSATLKANPVVKPKAKAKPKPKGKK